MVVPAKPVYLITSLWVGLRASNTKRPDVLDGAVSKVIEVSAAPMFPDSLVAKKFW